MLWLASLTGLDGQGLHQGIDCIESMIGATSSNDTLSMELGVVLFQAWGSPTHEGEFLSVKHFGRLRI